MQTKDFSEKIKKYNIAPLWDFFSQIVAVKPEPAVSPRLWRYDEIRPFIMEAGELVSTEDTSRRVLILENAPGHGITHTLYAGLQAVFPGEVAACHRHSQAAIRFIIEGGDAYTAVEGEKLYMERGDFITTPSWTWHDHNNHSDGPIIWLDGLDLPMANFLGASFAEYYPEANQPIQVNDDTANRFGAGMRLPSETSVTPHSPIYKYPYDQSREALEGLRRNGDPDPCDGYKLEYSHPQTGGHVMPTMAAFLQLLPAGFQGQSLRGSDSRVFMAVEGEGRTMIGDETFDWKENDVFVVPNWTSHQHSTSRDSILFSFSDQAALENLNLWREDRSAS